MSLKLTPGTCIYIETPTQLKRVLFANAKLCWKSGHRAMSLCETYIEKLPCMLHLGTAPEPTITFTKNNEKNVEPMIVTPIA